MGLWGQRRDTLQPDWSAAVQEMPHHCETAARCAAGVTEEFKVQVGRHRGSALSAFLFVTVMDSRAHLLGQESPQTMMFTYDTVICCESSWRKIYRGLGKDRTQGELTRRTQRDRRRVGMRDPTGTARLKARR